MTKRHDEIFPKAIMCVGSEELVRFVSSRSGEVASSKGSKKTLKFTSV